MGHCVKGLVVLSFITAPLVAGPYSELIVFGDTLSDNGNASEATLGLQPGPFYFEGRFSNGPVYAEVLSSGLELAPLAPSSLGGGNFAFGGAQTTGTGGLEGLIIKDIDEQVDDFIARGPADSNALTVLFAGANDLLGGQTDVDVPVTNLITDLRRLIGVQSEAFLILNLPLLGTTPRFNGDSVQAAAMNQLTHDFNSALAAALDDLEASEPDVTIFQFDVAGLINEVIADPDAFGFINVKDPAAPGLSPGDSMYNTDQIVSDPNSYLFWDELHPTAAAHAILAERALAIVPEPSGTVLVVAAIFALAIRGVISQRVALRRSERC